MMVRLTIDDQSVEVPEGSTVLDAACALGIDVPTLCFAKGKPAGTSCYVCVVQVEGRPGLDPACATVATEGMIVKTSSDAVHDGRRTALELLLSEHHGDCEGPCVIACPAGLDIPRMLEHLDAGREAEAVRSARERIPFNAILGRICPRFCERACRRADLDESVAIARLQQFVGDAGIAAGITSQKTPDSGKKVAVFGAGPAGLTAAYYLLLAGHACTIFDGGDEPGGRLRQIDESRLPGDVLDGEIDVVRRLGATFRMQTVLGPDAALWAQCRSDFDAVLLALGASKPDEKGSSLSERSGRLPDLALAEALGLGVTAKGIAADARTGATGQPDVFAAGECVTGANYAVRAVQSGRVAACAVDQFLAGRNVVGEPRPINCRMGRLDEEELAVVRRTASTDARAEGDGPLRTAQSRVESRRCLQCGCAARDDCALRVLATRYEAKTSRFKGPHRAFDRDETHAEIVYEPNKCILCGLCVRAAAEEGERLGLTFIDRGFAATTAVPFGRTLADGLRVAAEACVRICPTGALSFKTGAARTSQYQEPVP